MFPKDWTAERIKVDVDAAWATRIVVGDRWEGTTASGVKVEGSLRPRVTAYPVFHNYEPQR